MFSLIAGLRRQLFQRPGDATASRLRGILDWLRGYLPLWILLAVGLLVSWPGWYIDSRWESIMTNVFATLAVTPVLVFGVDRVVRRAEDLRVRPRQLAAMEELADAVAGCVMSLAALGSIDIMLPGFIAKAASDFPDKASVSDENARFLSDLAVSEALGRGGELERRLATLGLPDLTKLMLAAAQQQQALRARMLEAGSAVAPELYVRIVKLIRTLRYVERNAELATHIADGRYDMSRPEGVALRGAFERQYLLAVADAAAIYRDWSRGKKTG